MYEVYPLLSTIASASATIVAIIGGFIASKLISLSSERTEVELKSSEINEEIHFLEEKKDKAQNKLDEEDALTFIDERINDLIEKKKISQQYELIRSPNGLNFEKISSYWNRALLACEQLVQSIHEGSQFNVDNIPTELVEKLPGEFEYEVCKLIISELDRNPPNNFSIAMPKLPRVTGLWYRDLNSEISENIMKLEWLKISVEQLNIREKALRKPKGLILGLLLLVWFSFTGILLPLLHLNIISSDNNVYYRLKYTFIGILCVNLILTFLYFVYLLLWKKK